MCACLFVFDGVCLLSIRPQTEIVIPKMNSLGEGWHCGTDCIFSSVL